MFSEGWYGRKVAEFSNYFWLCDYTRLEVFLQDIHGSIVGRPWLTIVLDSDSECMMGFHLGFDPPSSQVLARSLRHAILPKHYDREYNPHSHWGTYGVPRHLSIGGESNIKSVDLEQIAVQLGLVLHQHHRPIDVAIVERFFTTSHTYFFSMLPGYTGSEGVNYLQADLRQIGLTLPKLEQRLVGYIVNNYNQSLDERYRDPTRFQRWQAGLLSPPRMMRQEDFDI